MNIIIAGSRKIGIKNKIQVFALFDKIFENLNLDPQEPITIFSGKANGMDTLGELYAKQKGWAIRDFYAKWSELGKAAGPIRNEEMICAGPNLVICFYLSESVGSKDLIWRAKRKKIKLISLELKI